jgi:hypothetical protein
METLTIEEASPANEYQGEDDLAGLWLELARDLIDHARITQEWISSRSASEGLSDGLGRGYRRSSAPRPSCALHASREPVAARG